jgi:hypothetical protein
MSNGGIGVRQSYTPSKLPSGAKTPERLSTAASFVSTQVSSDLEVGTKLSQPENRDFLPALARNLEGLVEFFDQTPEMMNVDVPHWEEPKDLNITPKNCSPGEVDVKSTTKDVNQKASFKEFLTDYKAIKSELKEMLQELKKDSPDTENIQSKFEGKLGKLLDYAEVIQDKIDSWQEKNVGKEKTPAFKKMNGLQAGLASDLSRLSRYAERVGDSVKTNKSPVYARLKGFAENVADYAKEMNSATLVQPNVNSLPTDSPETSVLPDAKDIFKVPYKEDFVTQMNYLLADTEGARETHYLKIDGLEYNKTDDTVCIHMDSVDGLRSKSVELPFKDGYKFKSMEDAENVIAKGSLDRGSSPKELLGSKRLFNKLKKQATAELESTPGYKTMHPDTKKGLLTQKFNTKYRALVNNLKPNIVNQLEQISKKGTVDFAPVDKGFKMTSTKVKSSWLSKIPGLSRLFKGDTVISVGQGKTSIQFKVTTTSRKEFSYKDGLKQRKFTADNPANGVMSVVAKGGKLFFKGKARGKNRIKELVPSNQINTTAKQTNKQLGTVTEIKSTIPKAMFTKCLPEPKGVFSPSSIKIRIENKIFKKAVKSVGLTKTKTFTNLIKEDIWPTSTQNKSLLGKVGVLFKLPFNLVYTIPVGLIVNAVITTAAHSKDDSLKLQSTMKSFKGNYEKLTKNLLGEVSRGTSKTVVESVKAAAQTTTSVGKTVKFALGSAFKNMMKDKFKAELESFHTTIQDTTNALGIEIPDNKADIEEMERLIDSGDFESAGEAFKLIDQKLTSTMNNRTKKLGALIDQMQENLLPAAKDASQLKSTLISARKTVNELTGLFLKSANSVQSIRSDLIKGTVEMLKNDSAMTELGNNVELGIKGSKGKVSSKLTSLMIKISEYESRKSEMSTTEKKNELDSFVSEFKELESISENTDPIDRRGLDSIMNSLESVMKPLDSIMKTYQSDIEVFSKDAPDPYNGMSNNIDFQMSLLEDVDKFKTEMNELPNMVAREFREATGSPQSLPLDMNEINQRMVTVEREMFQFLNTPGSKDDKVGFNKILTKLKNLETLTQTKTLQVDSLKLDTTDKNDVLKNIKPEIRRLLKNKQENIQDMVVKFMSMDVVNVLDAKGSAINSIASDTNELAVSGTEIDGVEDTEIDETTAALKIDKSFSATVSDMSNSLRDAAATTKSGPRKKALQTLSKSFEIAILSQREDKLKEFMGLIDPTLEKLNKDSLETMNLFKDKAELFRLEFVQKFGTEKATTIKSVEEKLSAMGLKNFEVYDCFENKATGAIEVSINTWPKSFFVSKKEPKIFKLKLPPGNPDLKNLNQVDSKSKTKGVFAKSDFIGKVGVSSEEETSLRDLLRGTNILKKDTYEKFFNGLSETLDSNSGQVDDNGPELTMETMNARNQPGIKISRLETASNSDTEDMSEYSDDDFDNGVTDRGSVDSSNTDVSLSSENDVDASKNVDNAATGTIELTGMDAVLEAQNKFSMGSFENASKLLETEGLPENIALFKLPTGGLEIDDYPKTVTDGSVTIEIGATRESEDGPIKLVFKKTDKDGNEIKSQTVTVYEGETEFKTEDEKQDVAKQFVDMMVDSKFKKTLFNGVEGSFNSGKAARSLEQSIKDDLNGVANDFDTTCSDFEFELKTKIMETPSLRGQLVVGASRDKIRSELDNRFEGSVISTRMKKYVDAAANRLTVPDKTTGKQGVNAAFERLETLKAKLEQEIDIYLKEGLDSQIQGNEEFFQDEMSEKMDELRENMNKAFLGAVGGTIVDNIPMAVENPVESSSSMDGKMKKFAEDLKAYQDDVKVFDQKSTELTGQSSIDVTAAFKGALSKNIEKMFGVEGVTADISCGDEGVIENKTFTLTGLVAQRTLEFSANYDAAIFSPSMKYGFPNVTINTNMDIKESFTKKLLSKGSNMDKLAAKLDKLKNAKPPKDYLSKLPDDFKIINVGYASFEDEDILSSVQVVGADGKEMNIVLEPDPETEDIPLLKSLAKGLAAPEERKPRVAQFEKKYLKGSTLKKLLKRDEGSFDGMKATIVGTIPSKESGLQGITIRIGKAGKKVDLNLNDVPGDMKADFEKALNTMWNDCKEEAKEELTDTILRQVNTRTDSFGNGEDGVALKTAFESELRNVIKKHIKFSMEDVEKRDTDFSIGDINRGIIHNSEAQNTSTDNLFQTADDSKGRVEKTCNDSLKAIEGAYNKELEALRGPKTTEFVEAKMKDWVGPGLKVDSVTFNSDGKVTDIMIVKKNRKDGKDRVDSFRNINRVKKGVNKSTSLGGNFDKLLHNINTGVQSLHPSVKEVASKQAVVVANTKTLTAVTNTISGFSDDSFKLFNMRPSSPSSPTELELTELEQEMNNFDQTVLIPLSKSLDEVTVDLSTLVPDLVKALEKGNTGDIKEKLNNLPPELKILFKRVTGIVHMIKEKTDSLSEMYNMSENASNLTGDLQLDDYFITKFMRTDDDSEMFLALEKNYGTIFNNSD